MIGGGTARAGESKGPEEPTRHVGIDAIAAVSVARPLRAGNNATAAAGAGSMPPVHEIRAGRRFVHERSTNAGRRRSARRSARRGIEHVGLAGVAGQDEPAADERRLGHDVGVGDPPGDRPVRLDRERLDLRLDEDVPEA